MVPVFPFAIHSIFSMDGDFALLPELVKLRRKYGFLLVVDDVCILSPLLSYIFFAYLCSDKNNVCNCFFKAHGTLVCGENGGGVPELFGCENNIDICLGSLSKGVGCQGGFIACR